MSKNIKLGLIGFTKGNGHPYSWSAIFNGYNKKLMSKCGFPVITKYLEKKSFPKDQIKNAKVTHIWTQDHKISKKISKTTYIANIVRNYKDLIGKVDAILLARDDAEFHFKYAKPFLEKGIPIYIDKPFALTLPQAKKIIDLQRYKGQIFSCSALRYAKELQLNKKQKKKIGKIKSIHAFVPKDWDKYSVHAIEPLIKLIPNRGKILKHKRSVVDRQTMLNITYKSKISVNIYASGNKESPIGLRIIGKKGWSDLFLQDTFKCFRASLKDFILGILERKVKISDKEILEVVKLIQLGRK